jgi:hypothetical protein
MIMFLFHKILKTLGFVAFVSSLTMTSLTMTSLTMTSLTMTSLTMTSLTMTSLTMTSLTSWFCDQFLKNSIFFNFQ